MSQFDDQFWGASSRYEMYLSQCDWCLIVFSLHGDLGVRLEMWIGARLTPDVCQDDGIVDKHYNPSRVVTLRSAWAIEIMCVELSLLIVFLIFS